MAPREFYNAWIGASGHNVAQIEAIRNIVYGAHRFNAANTAFSGDAARKIARMRFPWEKPQKLKALNYDDMKGFFKQISKN